MIKAANAMIVRMLRACAPAGIAEEFQEGHELDTKMVKKVPKAMVGKALSRNRPHVKKLDN